MLQQGEGVHGSALCSAWMISLHSDLETRTWNKLSCNWEATIEMGGWSGSSVGRVLCQWSIFAFSLLPTLEGLD